MIKSRPDEKEISVLVFLLLGSYNVFVGLSLSELCRVITYDVEGLDYALIIGAGICFLLNAFYDIFVNYHRNDDALAPLKEAMGHYITEENLCNYFKLLHVFGITSPNYFFEICEWLFIAILTWHTESMLYLVSTILILWVRAYNISLWMSK